MPFFNSLSSVSDCLFTFLFSDFVGPGDCAIRCMHSQGKFKDKNDGEGGTQPVIPRFRCITRDQGSLLKAWFGYENLNTHNIYIPIGNDNNIKATVPVNKEHMTSKFSPGLKKFAFYIG